MSSHLPKIIRNIHITGLDDEGRGRGHITINHTKWDCAVRGADVGQTIDAHVERIWLQRRLMQLNVTPPFSKRICQCATCTLGHLDAEKELALKLARLHLALNEAGVVYEQCVSPIINLESTATRVQGRYVHLVKNGHSQLGHYIPHTHTFQSVKNCPFEKPVLMKARQILCHHLDKKGLSASESLGLKNVRVVALSDNDVALTLTFDIDIQHQRLESLANMLFESVEGGVRFIQVHWLQSGQNKNNLLQTTWRHSFCQPNRHYRDDAGMAFYQADRELAIQMYQHVADIISDHQHAHVLDLYAGLGGFSQYIKFRMKANVTAVESNPAVESTLKKYADVVHIGSVENFLETIPETHSYHVAVIDPPRRGLLGLYKHIHRLRFQKIVLVSCDLKSLTRDMKALSECYRLEHVTPVDLFQGTTQIEVISVWHLKK